MTKPIKTIGALFVLCCLLAACSQAAMDNQHPMKSSPDQDDKKHDTKLPDLPEQMYGKHESDSSENNPNSDSSTNDAYADDPETDLSSEAQNNQEHEEPFPDSDKASEIDEDEDEVKTAEDSGAQTPDSDKEKNTIDKPKVEPLRLMGYTIDQPRQEILTALGAPTAKHVIKDPTGEVQIHQYSGFTIGYNSSNRIEFIDVHDATADAKLEEIQVGQPVSGVTEKLGEPASQSDYVVNYLQDGIYLKFDIDPQQQTIQSIKLFRAN